MYLFFVGEGADTKNPCSEVYAGAEPFSEIETRTLSEYLRCAAERMNNEIYLSYHSYSQLLLFPWGYTKEHAPSYDVWVR